MHIAVCMCVCVCLTIVSMAAWNDECAKRFHTPCPGWLHRLTRQTTWRVAQNCSKSWGGKRRARQEDKRTGRQADRRGKVSILGNLRSVRGQTMHCTAGGSGQCRKRQTKLLWWQWQCTGYGQHQQQQQQQLQLQQQQHVTKRRQHYCHRGINRHWETSAVGCGRIFQLQFKKPHFSWTSCSSPASASCSILLPTGNLHLEAFLFEKSRC